MSDYIEVPEDLVEWLRGFLQELGPKDPDPKLSREILAGIEVALPRMTDEQFEAFYALVGGGDCNE